MLTELFTGGNHFGLRVNDKIRLRIYYVADKNRSPGGGGGGVTPCNIAMVDGGSPFPTSVRRGSILPGTFMPTASEPPRPPREIQAGVRFGQEYLRNTIPLPKTTLNTIQSPYQYPAFDFQ